MDSNPKLIGTTVLKHFKLTKRLGTGAFGQIYLAVNTSKSEQTYAAKIQELNAKHPQLYFEAKLYRLLNADGIDRGIPKIYAMSTEGSYNIMLMDLLGPSLEDLLIANNRKFSLKTVLLIADQLLQRIQFIHSKQFLHRDIKPDNFLIGKGKKADKIYMIDLGLAKKYTKDGKHIPYKQGKQLTGTARYASINTHIGIQQARRDDIESIGYVLMYFLKGILPWQNMKSKDTKTKYAMIKDKKMSTPTQVLCSGFPQQFVTYLNYAKGLKFQVEPDYQYLRGLFRKVRQTNNFNDEKYDWSVEQMITQKPLTYIPQTNTKELPKKIEQKYIKMKQIRPPPEVPKIKKNLDMSIQKSNGSSNLINFKNMNRTKTSSQKPTLYQVPKVVPPKISKIQR